jgi:hypothetical protein
MSINDPQERPDLYDSYDVPEQDFVPNTDYMDATMPSWMRNLIVSHAREQANKTSDVEIITVEPAINRVKQWGIQSSVTLVSLSGNCEGDDLRTSEINALLEVINQLRNNEIQPGPLILDTHQQ